MEFGVPSQALEPLSGKRSGASGRCAVAVPQMRDVNNGRPQGFESGLNGFVVEVICFSAVGHDVLPQVVVLVFYPVVGVLPEFEVMLQALLSIL